jgi:hypothetical protein
MAQGVEHLQKRALSGGGFAMYPGGEFRADATAWAVMTLTALGAGDGLSDPARQRLAAVQLQDGRVSISPEHPEAYWPTPLALLAWQGAPGAPGSPGPCRGLPVGNHRKAVGQGKTSHCRP